MKKIFLLVPLLLFSCNKKNINWFEGTYDEALEKNNQQIIMIDFYTDW
tara:strand:- start:192 stop:335 length:144 start_codon:yes stop_codon:yes gene_type:complete